eukprot:scaffold4707_cov96-Skeletonema_dohrnii-CCMP3373.AAC.10
MTEDTSFVVARGPTTHPFYHPDSSPANYDKSLKDCKIENNDILIVFSSIAEYEKVLSEKRSTVHLAPDESIKGKFRLVEVTDDAGNTEYFKAVPDENGDPLFSPKHVFMVVNQTMIEMQRSGWKFILLRDNLGVVKEHLFRGKFGKRIKCTLKTIHYNLNAGERYPTGARTVMGRGLMYEFSHLFNKDQYTNQLSRISTFLSEGLRICVGEQFVSIPERAFSITRETKGRYDGKLRFEYKKGEEVVGFFDCQQPINRLNNTNGYTAPDYCARSRLGMEIIGCDFDEVDVVTNAKFILVCEDGIVFNYLRQVKVWDHVPVVLVCAHGFPCNDTVAFVHMLHTTLQLPVFGICDMNVGGVDVLHTFGSGSVGEYALFERDLFVSMVKWMMLRPSQLKKLRTSRRPDARNLLHSSFKAVADMFGKRRKGRLDNHISEKTSWIENGGKRKEEQSRR